LRGTPTNWVVTCESAAEARAAIAAALRILEQLGVQLHPQKTRIVNVRSGFEFLGYKIKRGQRRLRLSPDKIRSRMQPGALYAYPREKSIRHFMDQVRQTRFEGFDDKILSLYARGLSTREIGRVENRAVYVALGIDWEGRKEVLGLGAATMRALNSG
jgi:hypothetical protein